MEAYQKLDIRIQKWIYKQGWPDLRAIQKKAVDPILAADRDVLISASTAAGKTEAAFLPACTAISDCREGFGIVYISPLKALINDQYRRLEGLCEQMDLAVTPWHGDAARSRKKRAWREPSGILLITPESLEAMLINHPGWVKEAFASLRYLIIDEFHAFIGSERGHHMLSLLNRLDHLVGRLGDPVPRIALSATLGEIERVPPSLRPNGRRGCEIITDDDGKSTIRVQVKGFLNPIDLKPNDPRQTADQKICDELYRVCRGDSHLVFANSRKRTEAIAADLTDRCEQNGVPNEFFPHHGSLSKELREDLEIRLQQERLPTTAVCTTTLELGIDIGKVNSIVQVAAAPSVSSLRQRLGRSGRRGGAAVLRAMIAEDDLTPESSINDKLRLELVQSLAMIRLLIRDQWFEPADTHDYHLSTLIHQVLAITAQWGGIQAGQLYTLLCREGPFSQVNTDQFKALLGQLGECQCLTQLGTGELVLGVEGERLVNQYTFYAVFQTPEEYRVVNGSRTIGSLPVETMILPEQHIVFAGKRWIVLDVDKEGRVIHVQATKGGKPPTFGGTGPGLHDMIREEMQRIYREGDYRIETSQGSIDFADASAWALFEQGVAFFNEAGLDTNPVIKHNREILVVTWRGDKLVNTLTAALVMNGFRASNYAGVIEIIETTRDSVFECLETLRDDGMPNETVLAEIVPEKLVEKYDELLPESLLTEGYGRRFFDSAAAECWLNQVLAR